MRFQLAAGAELDGLAIGNLDGLVGLLRVAADAGLAHDRLEDAEVKNEEAAEAEDISEVLSDYSGISIVEAFIQNGMDPSFKNRREYAKTAGIEDYIGSAEQNLYLIEYMGGSLEKKKP